MLLNRLPIWILIGLLFVRCDSSTNRFSPEELWYKVQLETCRGKDSAWVWTYDVLNPFHIQQAVKGDSVIVSFDFVSDCCLTFSGRPQVKQDTLIIEYGLAQEVGDEGYGCWCDYNLTFRMYKAGRSWKEMKMVYSEEIFGRDGIVLKFDKISFEELQEPVDKYEQNRALEAARGEQNTAN